MTTKNQTKVVKDLKEKSILVSREFNAPVETIWRAYTDPEILDQWWGPAPWKTVTKTMNFTVGGHWLYAMVGPDNQTHWSRMDYLAIDRLKSYDVKDSFCDENGNINASFPVSSGRVLFTKTSTGTFVEWKLIYSKEEDVMKIIEMGFEQGISLCIEQLEQLINLKKI